MAPAMKSAMKSKAMKAAKAMTKSQLADQLATKSELKKKEVLSVLQNLSEIGASEVTTTGKFVLPGLCMIKTRVKPATKGGTRMMFGKEVQVKAQKAKTIVKATPVAALKSQAMKAAKAMTKSQLADQLATKSELKKKEVLSVLQNLSEIGASEEVQVKAQKAKTIVKATPVAALKSQV
ncbi:HCc2 [Symbiodinium sp. CCMP2592]|nr:HCc2 [Symbiodinium sp. CCMP2592]